MRLQSIEIEGFGPFKQVQSVDFTQFDDYGIFLIAGRTGAGKSTILDAICFALYGSVPRYDDYSGTVRLRSDHCTPDDVTSVTLTFEAQGRNYRITRSPEYERPKLRGEGLAKQTAAVLLEQQTADGWEGLETKAREVAELIAEVVKLDKKEFLQVALLAQNRFQRFLEAESKDRQTLLRRLFGTRRFDEYTDALAARAQALSDQVRSSSANSERIVADLSAEFDASPPQPAIDERDWAKDLTAAAAAAAAQAQRAELDAEKHSRTAGEALAQAQDLEQRQRRRADAAASLETLKQTSAGIEQKRAQLKVARVVAELHPYAAAVKASRQNLEAAEREHDAATALLPNAPAGDLREHAAGLAETIGSLTTATQTESRLPQLMQSERRARAALADAQRQAAAEAERRRREVERLTQEQIKALDALTAATKLEKQLREAHLHGRAALLAKQLTPGDACPVCGSTEHPAPALLIGDPVTDDDLETAEQQRQRAQRLADEASAARAQAETRAAETTGADQQIQARGMELAVAERQLQDAQSSLQQDLEGHATIAERVTALTRQRDALGRLAEARDQLVHAANDHSARRRELQTQLERRGYAELKHAAAVALPKAERDALEAEIADYDARRNQLVGVLELPELQQLPEQRPDVEALTTAATAAANAYRQATEERVRAQGRAVRSKELTTKLEHELSSSAQTRRQLEIVDGLARAAKGDAAFNQLGIPLERFVLAAELEEIVKAANVRLRVMSQGRYTIEHSDDRTRGGKSAGLELVIYDAHTGLARVPQSLSGGEKFLASLALALGMAEVVTARAGGITLDTLFIDEGFGSLDAETLESAMQTLDQLRQGGRTVGLISHVETMQEQIPAKLEVSVNDDGSSRITASV